MRRALGEKLEAVIRREMEAKKIPAFAIALVEGRDILWSGSFGDADPERGIPATADTIYRVGSVSKLFTDIAILQLAERGAIDLDEPIGMYLPDFRPRNPYGTPITLRQIMSHRSGLAREPPVGNYFDPTEPSLEATVESLNATELVYEPGTRTKYSNAGIAVAGRVLEELYREPFSRSVSRLVLEPMGLEQSSFRPGPELRARLARSFMWTYDGRRFEAPVFDLGTSPAGNLCATTDDLARFIGVLLDGGRTPRGEVLRAETLEEMWTPQFAPAGEKTGFGLGFHVSELDGRRLVGHDGAVYGFSTTLALLPEAGLGVVAVATLDVTNAVTGRIARHALRSALALRAGTTLPELEGTTPVGASRRAALAGRYAGEDGRVVEILRRGERILLDGAEKLAEIRGAGDDLVVDDRHTYGARIRAAANGDIFLSGAPYRRTGSPRPPPPPPRWRGLIGEYGWDHNVLYIREKEGKLHALIEWFFDYPLEELSDDVFAFPDDGLYQGERLIFRRGNGERAVEVVAAQVLFPRRAIGAMPGDTFRIEPLAPVEDLREQALAAEPPPETGAFRTPDLVELTSLEPTIRYDIRYASTENFLAAVFYPEPRALLQRPAAEALVRAHARLREQGYGIIVYDAYRPWHVTKMFWDATPPALRSFVADPAEGSRHNRGCAVDVSLYEIETGEPAPMVAGYDEFSVRSYPYYPGGTSEERWHRRLLRESLEAEGFTIYEYEWWHFDYKDWREFAIGNTPFDELPRS